MINMDCKHAFSDETVDEEGYSTCIFCGLSEKNKMKNYEHETGDDDE